MNSYYNENDKKAAAWLRELINEGLIAKGEVDERSITDVRPEDLRGFTQCHFFAGIGGWSYALRLAGWPDDVPVWTGSCPCQPFSAAGKGRGTADERHLWPVFAELIRAKKPTTVFGEQVASKAGRSWLSGVFADLEGMGYSRAGTDLCAAGVGAPHIRQRLFWVAQGGGLGDSYSPAQERLGRISIPMEPEQEAGRPDNANAWSNSIFIGCADGKSRRTEPSIFPLAHGIPGRVGLLRGAGNAIVPQVAAEFIGAYMDCYNA